MVRIRATRGWASPYHWAGFLRVGDPANGGLATRH